MTRLTIFAFLLSFIMQSCVESRTERKISSEGTSSRNQIVSSLADTTVQNISKDTMAAPDTLEGDFNGDGRTDKAWLIGEPDNGEEGCIDTCNCVIFFSDSVIKPLNINNCIGGKPVNLGDLNDDAVDEIGLLPDWFTSCWHGFIVSTFRNGEWSRPIPPVTTHCVQWERGIVPVEKDKTRKGYVIIHYSELDIEAGELLIKDKPIPID